MNTTAAAININLLTMEIVFLIDSVFFGGSY